MNPENQVATEASTRHKKMPIFTCCCGTKILIVPDVKEMGKALREHEAEHRRITGQRVTQEALAQQILKALSEHFFQGNLTL